MRLRWNGRKEEEQAGAVFVLMEVGGLKVL